MYIHVPDNYDYFRMHEEKLEELLHEEQQDDEPDWGEEEEWD